jgi:hypothetical protein
MSLKSHSGYSHCLTPHPMLFSLRKRSTHPKHEKGKEAREGLKEL